MVVVGSSGGQDATGNIQHTQKEDRNCLSLPGMSINFLLKYVKEK